ncbi:MAG: exodeoxyribonuclease VII small subunit [Clostridia bacterium]|jgi:exodeoxyribonuclease VII small subunit|nr:exodeoxyribonuclease VII small subunit [Clostridia bacterium]
MAVKTFEESMTELEGIVSQLEIGEITLDDSLKLFEQGIKLAKNCRKKLDDAEKKVKILTIGENGEPNTEDFGGIE